MRAPAHLIREEVSSVGLCAVRVKRRRHASGSSGVRSRLSRSVPREWDVWVFESSAAACSVYLGFVMPSFLMR